MPKSLRDKYLSVLRTSTTIRGGDAEAIVGFETKLERHLYDGNINSGSSLTNNSNTTKNMLRIEHNGGSEGAQGGADYFDYRQSPFYKAFEPLMFYMRMFGIFYDEPSHGLSRGLPSPPILYCWTVTLVAWANFVVTLTAIRNAPVMEQDFMVVLAASVWILLMSLNASGLMHMSANPKQRRLFFQGLEQLRNYGGPSTNPAKLRSKCTAISTFFFLLCLANAFVINYGMFYTHSYDVILANVISADAESWTVTMVKSLNAVVTVYLSAMWLFPVCLELCLGMLLYTEFRLYRRAFLAKIQRERGQLFVKSFDNERRHFLIMTKIVKAADSCLAVHHGAVFLCDIGNICIMLYMLAYLPMNSAIAASLVFWTICWFFDMAVVCIVGILINSGAHQVVAHLHELTIEGVTSDFSIQVTLFLRSVDEYLGFTVCHLFTIDRPVVLSLCGMLITYFLVLVQFASASMAASNRFSSNCTATRTR